MKKLFDVLVEGMISKKVGATEFEPNASIRLFLL
jgi:hypothetical protein